MRHISDIYLKNKNDITHINNVTGTDISLENVSQKFSTFIQELWKLIKKTGNLNL